MSPLIQAAFAGRAALALAALALVLSAAPLAHAQQAPAAAVSPRALALGGDLAKLLNDEETTRLQTRKMIRETVPAAFNANPDIAALEKLYPGMIKYVVDRMEPEIMRQTLVSLPQLWARLGAIYASALNEAELTEVSGFFHRPVGQKLVQIMTSEMDFSAALTRMLAANDETVKTSDLDAAQRAALPELMRNISRQEGTEILRFASTPAGQKLRELRPKLLQVAAEWSNESDPAEDALIEKIVEEAMTEFVEKTGAKQ